MYAPKAIDTLQDVYESGLPVEMMDCLEMEGHISQDTDPIVKHIYDNRIVTPFTPWLQGYFSNILNVNLWYYFGLFFQVDNVYKGKAIVMDFRSGMRPIVDIKYSSSSGTRFIHNPKRPAYPPIYPNVFNFNKINAWRDQFDKVIQTLCL